MRCFDRIFGIRRSGHFQVTCAQLLQIRLKDSEWEFSSVADVFLNSVEDAGVVPRNAMQDSSVVLIEEATFHFHCRELCFVMQKTHQICHRTHDALVVMLPAI